MDRDAINSNIVRFIPLNYKLCKLYGLKSKKKLLELLYIERKIYCKGSFVNSKIHPFIMKERLVEAPNKDIKRIQSCILAFLQKLDFPDYVYSGVKGKSYINNARLHGGNGNLFKVDISKFFPNISRERVFNFYNNKLSTSIDVANILTNFSTINIENTKNKRVNDFVIEKNIKSKNHLITGSPLSPLLSYLANVELFDNLANYARDRNLTISIYVDDVVFSSKCKISRNIRADILNTIHNYGYQTSKKKCRWYNNSQPKKITGVILDKNNAQLQVPNKLMKKTHNYITEIKNNDFTNKQQLMGCTIAVNSINGKLKSYRAQLKKIIKNKN